jgi:hypothetical protein
VDNLRGLKPEDISDVPLEDQIFALLPKINHDERGPQYSFPPEFEELAVRYKGIIDKPLDYSKMDI